MKQILMSLIIVAISCTLSIVSANQEYGSETPDAQDVQAQPNTNRTPKLPVGLIIDRNFSAHTGASGLTSLLRGYQALDEEYLPATQGDTSAYMMLGRFGKIVLENILFSTVMITQHEVFGHGGRAREFKLPIIKYSIRPYKGSVSYRAEPYLQLSKSEQIAFITGGMEGTGILAKRIRDRWVDTQILDYREAHLYLVNALDQTTYILHSRTEKIFDNSNDVTAYIAEINHWHGSPVLNRSRLKQKAYIDLLDPYLFYSLYSMAHYMRDGSACWEYPMIPIGDYRYLPGFRLALAPYGPEYQFINYIKGPEHSIQATFRYGKTGARSSLGTSLEVTRLLSSDLFNVDAKIDLWRQPKLFVSQAQAAKPQLGGGFSLIGRYRVFDSFELIGQLGYKTTGFVPGDPLKNGPILRAGFNANL